VKVIAIDPGHDEAHPGTSGARGIAEVAYNDALAAAVKLRLDSDGRYQAVLTRSPGQAATLRERIDAAERIRADLFLSVHHDSAQEKYLRRITKDGKAGWETTVPIQGYSLFVSSENGSYEESIRLARLLGEELNRIGRPPSLHHAEPIAGESRELLRPEVGVYRYDTLAVLQKTRMPAVLLEAGLIVDIRDEAYLSDPRNQERMAAAIAAAIGRFFE
jgi:N-acetylmuramoyl-L-alanine amidase